MCVAQVNTDDGRVITIVVPAHAQSGSTIQMQVPQAVRRSEPRRVEPPARPLPNLPNMPVRALLPLSPVPRQSSVVDCKSTFLLHLHHA